MGNHVLIIDDDPAIRTALTLLLRACGREVLTAANGGDGLILFQQHQPRVVLTDMTMPGLSGVEIIRQLRGLSGSVAIIAMSGSILEGQSSALHQAIEAGADICLDKPFDSSELLAALDKIAPRP